MAFFVSFLEKRPFFPFGQRGLKIFFIFSLVFLTHPSFAVKIHFPEEELASESVLPLLDKPRMVLHKNVSLKWSLEIGAGLGLGMDEPFYSPYYPSGFLALHFTEVQALSLTGIYFLPQLSTTGAALKKGVQGEEDGELKILDAHKIPYPQMSFFLNYQYTPFYGKISLSKSGVMNLSIYGFVGPGFVISNQNNQWPAGNVGIGQKLYFTKWFGLRGDLSFYGYYGPVVSKMGTGPDGGQGMVINILANIGVIFLI